MKYLGGLDGNSSCHGLENMFILPCISTHICRCTYQTGNHFDNKMFLFFFLNRYITFSSKTNVVRKLLYCTSHIKTYHR